MDMKMACTQSILHRGSSKSYGIIVGGKDYSNIDVREGVGSSKIKFDELDQIL